MTDRVDRDEGGTVGEEGGGAHRRRRLALKDELLLALLPTATVLAALALLERFAQQRVLFPSLAGSAFLIYLDPLHATNSARVLSLAHGLAAGAGWLAYALLGHGYAAAALAMVATILLMILLDVVHPPAVATSLTFAFRTGAEREVALFALALAMVVVLVLLQRAAVWALGRRGGR